MQQDADRLDLVFTALADRTRRAMLARLGQGGTTVGELGRPFGLSKPAITKHVRMLERAGLIRRSTDPADRRSRHIAAHDASLRRADIWIRHHRKFWNDRIDAMEAHLERTRP